MTRYRAAVIGLGRMGSTFDDEIQRGGSLFLPYCHAPAYDASPHTELVAGADPHDEQRALFGERWGISSDHLYTDYREMLEKENLDVVSVTTTAKIRAQIVQDAALAGVKAIWAEKPISFSLAEADAMVQTCEQQGTALAVNCARRWNPFYYEARQMVEAGELGDILQVTAYSQSGISHNGSHIIDIMRYMAGDGKVDWVFAEMESDEAAAGDDDLTGNGYLAFANGARGYYRSTPTGAAGWDLDVIGEKARVRVIDSVGKWQLLRLEDPSEEAPYGTRSLSRRARGALPAEYPFPWPARMQGMGLTIVDDLVNAIETGQPPRCSGRDGRDALEIAIAMRESHRRGGVKVDLPIEDRSLLIRSLEAIRGDLPARVRREMEQQS